MDLALYSDAHPAPVVVLRPSFLHPGLEPRTTSLVKEDASRLSLLTCPRPSLSPLPRLPSLARAGRDPTFSPPLPLSSSAHLPTFRARSLPPAPSHPTQPHASSSSSSSSKLDRPVSRRPSLPFHPPSHCQHPAPLILHVPQGELRLVPLPPARGRSQSARGSPAVQPYVLATGQTLAAAEQPRGSLPSSVRL